MRTIGEVSAAFGIKQHILRYWEQQFPMLEPLKRSGGRRLYRPADVALVARIDRLVNREGYTIKGARQALKTSIVDPVDDAISSPPPVGQGDKVPDEQVLDRLREIRERLAKALATS